MDYIRKIILIPVDGIEERVGMWTPRSYYYYNGRVTETRGTGITIS